MTLAVLIQAVKDTGGAPFDWSGIWQVAVALPGIAFTGFSGLPVRKARISKVFHA